MIIGEAEIQGQVKRSYELALVEGATGPILNRLFRAALAAGKRARTETAISERSMSIPSVAVELAQRTLGELEDPQGPGRRCRETAELTARALAAKGVQAIFIANRHYDRRSGSPTASAATRCDSSSCRGAHRRRHRRHLDQLAHHVIEREELAEVMKARDGRPLLLIDLRGPRDIHPASREVPGPASIATWTTCSRWSSATSPAGRPRPAAWRASCAANWPASTPGSTPRT